MSCRAISRTPAHVPHKPQGERAETTQASICAVIPRILGKLSKGPDPDSDSDSDPVIAA